MKTWSGLAADGLVAALFVLGQTLPFFYSRNLPLGWLVASGLALFCAGLVILLSRRWWLVPASLLILAGPVTLILARLRLLTLVLSKITAYLLWCFQLLLDTGPSTSPSSWLLGLQLGISLLLMAVFFAFVRKWGSILAGATLMLATFLIYLPRQAAPLPLLLPGLAGLAALLPGSLVKEQKKAGKPAGALPAAQKWLALAVAIACVLTGQKLTPADTSRWVQKDLLNLISDWGDFFQGSLAWDSSQSFDLAQVGYPSATERLGGPARPGKQVYLNVSGSRPHLLRGTVRTVYTGSNWQDPATRSYRLGSPLWRLLERQIFGQSLPAGLAGRSFASRYKARGQLIITPKSRWQSTIFQAGHLERLDFPDHKFFPPYFDWDGDLFVKESYPAKPAYTVSFSYYDQDLTAFASQISQTGQALDPGRDPFWPAVKERYLQLPDILPQAVSQLASSVTETAADPYARAVLLKSYLLENFSYTLDADLLPENEDFVAFFLETGQGYCIHFATAMTVMARSLGLPARYVEGFYLRPEGDGSKQESFLAAADTAHAWSEIYFEGIGWLEFDPTPPAAGEIEPPEPEVLPSVSPQPEEETPEPEDNEPDEDLADEGQKLWPVLALLFPGMVLLLTSLALFLSRRQKKSIQPAVFRRLHPEAGLCLKAAFFDIEKQLACLGIRQQAGETLLDFARRADGFLASPGLPELFWPVLRLVFGRQQPEENDLTKILQLRQQLEERLLADLSRPAWFYKRVLGRLGKN